MDPAGKEQGRQYLHHFGESDSPSCRRYDNMAEIPERMLLHWSRFDAKKWNVNKALKMNVCPEKKL